MLFPSSTIRTIWFSRISCTFCVRQHCAMNWIFHEHHVFVSVSCWNVCWKLWLVSMLCSVCFNSGWFRRWVEEPVIITLFYEWTIDIDLIISTGEKLINSIFKYGCGQSVWTITQTCGKYIVHSFLVFAVRCEYVPFTHTNFQFFFVFSLFFLCFFIFQIPNHFTWLCFFYLTFHSFLNLVGELLHFADRNFYCDWWNANNIDTFWRSWNMPVHRWCVRHIYIPIVDLGYNRSIASLIVFFVSAFFHEYLVSKYCSNQ